MSQEIGAHQPNKKVWHDGPVALCSKGRRGQHFFENDEYVVCFSGNIYEATALAKTLHLPSNTPNAALFGAAWRRWGIDLSERMDGAFSAVIWSKSTQELHLIRDLVGTRPLYWTRTHERFAFSTDLSSLIQAPWVSTEIDRRNVAEYLSFRTIHAPRTMLRDVRSLQAAHALSLTEKRLEIKRYWAMKYSAVSAERYAEGELVHTLQSAMNEAVRRRLPPSQMAALYLSGGLGSTAIAAAARTLHRKLPSYTISFDDDPHPESPFAGRVAKLMGLEHHLVVVGTGQIARSFQSLIDGMDQPIGNPAALLQYLLAKEVSQSAAVAFCGDGSVELFGGRMLAGLARNLRIARRIERLPGPARQLTIQALRPLPNTRRWTQNNNTYGYLLGLGGTHLFSVDQQRQLLQDEQDVRPHVRQTVLEPFYAELETDPMNAVLNAFFHSLLMEDCLVRSRKTAALHGLDMRFPLLDKRILDAAAAIPGHLKVQKSRGSLHTRWPLRAMLKGVLPPPLVNRPKRWMPAPLDAWLTGPGRIFFEERLAKLQQNRHDLWNGSHIDTMRQQMSRAEGTGAKLWALFILDAWLDRLVDRRLRG